MTGRGKRMKAVAAAVACLVALPAGYAVAREVAPAGDSPWDGVEAEKCPAAVNSAFQSKGLAPDSYVPDCPTADEAASEARYHNELRRYGLTKIAESIREKADPGDQEAQAELETIEKELDRL